ncbi:MAG TPA: SpoIIE family protein phosphatase [Bryobacteraceae bacterium]
MNARNHNRRLYQLLGIVFVLAMGYQIWFSITGIQYRQHYDAQVAWPFELSPDSDRFFWIDPALKNSGLQAGDQLLEIEGRSYEGLAQLVNVLSGKRPGGRLAIKVLDKRHAQAEALTVPLKARESNDLSVLGWIVVCATLILTPTFCLLLGFAVAAIRPRDPLAWLLLALMLSFAQMSTGSDILLNIFLQWPPILRTAAIFYHTFVGDTWSIWILLFGIYFPERLGLDRRLPWLKWLFIGPIAVSAFGNAVSIAGDTENFRMFDSLRGFLSPLHRAAFYIGMAAISSFFMAIGMKMGTASSTDARRRLILLINGTSVALTPLFLLVLYGLISGRGLDNVPESAWIPCVLMLAVFPITLAYVIVVQRALDVRVVVRQGLRYALAKRGVLVLQIIAFAVVAVATFTLATDPSRNRARKIQAISLGFLGIMIVRRGSEKFRGWLDRRFFREAYNAEQILNELSNQVRTMVETGPLLETVAQQISGSLHVPRIAMLVRNDGHYGPAYALGFSAPPETVFAQNGGTVEHIRRSREPLRIYFDDPDSWIYSEPSMTESDRDRLHKLEAQLLLPLAFKEKLIGFMSLSSKQSEEPYSKSDLQLLQSVAMQTGLALENSQLTQAIASEVAQRERMNRELEIAREVQERLFPQSYPAMTGLDYAGRCRPALGVGGDYYDFLELPDGSLGIGIGDVSGKGIPAALLMASLQASLRGQTISGQPDLAKLMTNVNKLIFETSPSNRYATFFYGQYDPATQLLTYVNGGHNPPMIFREGEVLRLEEGGPVVGLFKPSRYAQASVQMASGDVMVLFTDGISEAMNLADEEWDEERLMASVRDCWRRPAIEMIHCLIRDADAFVAGAPQHDDMTIMIVKVL